MSLIKRKRPGQLAEKQSGVTLTREDLASVLGLMRAAKKSESETLRELVHEAIATRRLKASGHDFTDAKIKQLQREAVHTETEVLRGELIKINELLSRQNGLLEQTLIKAREAAAISVETLLRGELIAQLGEHYWTRHKKLAEGMSEADIERQIKDNRQAISNEIIEVITNAQIRARKLASE